MSTLSAKKLNEALSKAKNVGLVEESFTIEDCELTLRNLRPAEYADVLQDCSGLESVEYLNAYQRGHLARSIVAINGIDLHSTDFVEVEEDDPKKPGQVRTVKLELHTYLNKHVLRTWSKEAVYTAMRKFGDVVAAAERKAKDGITFVVADETPEEKYRRLLLEAKECEDEIPATMLDSILDDMGFMRKSTADEIKAAMARTDALAREQEVQAPTPEPVPVAPEPVVSRPIEPEPEAPQAARRPSVADPHVTLQQAIAARQAPVPAPATPVVQAAQGESPAVSRTSEIAALEADLPTSLPGSHGPIEVYRPEQRPEPVELRQRQQPFDASAASAILDKPPAAGINPRFRPPPKV